MTREEIQRRLKLPASPEVIAELRSIGDALAVRTQADLHRLDRRACVVAAVAALFLCTAAPTTVPGLVAAGMALVTMAVAVSAMQFSSTAWPGDELPEELFGDPEGLSRYVAACAHTAAAADAERGVNAADRLRIAFLLLIATSAITSGAPVYSAAAAILLR